MWTKLREFFESDLGEIVIHCVVAAVLMLLVDWWLDDYLELVGGVAIIMGFIVRELAQHEWKFSEMGIQSWKEWIYPAIIVLIIYAV